MPPKPRMSPGGPGALAIALFLLLSPLPSGAVDYTFVSVAEVAAPFSSMDVPAINDEGAVAFFAYLEGGGQAICRADPGGIDIISDTITGPFVSFTGVGSFQLQNRPDLDNLGRVAYRAYLFEPPFDYHAALFLDDGVTRVALTDWGSGAVHRLDWSNATTNGNGLCAFTGLAGGLQGIHVATPSAYDIRLDESDGFSATFSNPSLSPGGDLSFSGVTLAGQDGIWALLGGTLHAMARTGIDIYNHSTESSLNDSGQVVFHGEPEEFVRAIMAATVDSVWTIVDDGVDPFNDLGEPAINNAGLVVFHARLSGYRQGLFTGPDADHDAIILTGDPLFGSICNEIQFANGGLNQHGQVAFVYGLEDGRMGIAVGTPEPVAVPVEGEFPGAASDRLMQIWPNPTTGCVRLLPTTRDAASSPTADILDSSGRLVRRLGPGDALPGRAGWSWDGCDAAGQRTASGVYFVRIGGGEGRIAGRLIVRR